jgi:uncharacterized UPF0146 family protein
MDEIRRLATRMSLGGSLPCLKFFEPTKKFLRWMKRGYSTSLIYDVGAGVGHVATALRKDGLKVLAIDLNYRESEGPRQITIADGESYRYERDSVVMVCRPCHGQFTEQVIEQASRCGAATFLYAGLKKNVENDLGVYLDQFKLALSGAGRDGEGVWVAQKED